MPTPPDDVVLQAAFDETLHELRMMLTRDGRLVIESFVLILHPGGVAFTVILEPRRQFQTIRDALKSVGGFGFVYVHDGHVDIERDGKGERREALLIVKGSRASIEAMAYPYERTPFGVRFDVMTYPAPPHLVDKYREVWWVDG